MHLRECDLTSESFKKNPNAEFARLRTMGPVVLTRLPLIGKVWVTTTYEATSRVLRDQDAFVREPRNAGKRRLAGMKWWIPRTFRALAENMLGKDEPDHRRLRGLTESAFSRRSVEEMTPHIVELADSFVDDFAKEAKGNGGTADLIAPFARPFPLAVICELLGLPGEDREKFIRWASGLSTAGSTWTILKAAVGLGKLRRYLQKQFRVMRQHPRPGMISELIAAEQDGDKLTEEELLATAFLLLLAGHETTVHLISGAVLTLLMHPKQLERLRSDWSLAESAIDEVLRYFSPVQMTKPRFASHDLELCGQQICRGDNVVALLAAANSDPAQFPDPDSFDIDRSPNAHLAFGGGIHICLGLKLARVEAAVALERFFTRFPDTQLASNPAELAWTRRLGMRVLSELPLQVSRR